MSDRDDLGTYADYEGRPCKPQPWATGGFLDFDAEGRGVGVSISSENETRFGEMYADGTGSSRQTAAEKCGTMIGVLFLLAGSIALAWVILSK